MPIADDLATGSPTRDRSMPSWGWIHISVAALAMVATLPGRTHGLGLFTEPILASTGIGRETFGYLNLAATLVGALFCLPCGWLADRIGTRRVLVTVQLALAAVVIAMGSWTGLTGWTLAPAVLFVFITLTRGLGQSALSTASLSLAGRSAPGQPDLAMGVFAAMVSLGFVVAFGVLGEVISGDEFRWQRVWTMIGVVIAIAAGVSGLLVRDDRLAADAAPAKTTETKSTWGQFLKSPVFWTFAVGSAFYALVAAGLTLFNQSLFADLGFDVSVFLTATILGIPIGLAANLAGGWAALRVPIEWLFSVALWVLAASMIWLPRIQTETQLYGYAGLVAASGGIITVAYFSVWRRHFGATDLGKIQGTAQTLTVVFSAAGPAIFGAVRDRTGSYFAIFPYLAAVAAALAIAAMLTRTRART